MEESTVARIREWDRREVGDGRVGLSNLADGEFSGAVEAGGAWLFMLNGRIVGERGGSADSLGVHDRLTAYTAPHPSLPLLFAMWVRGGNTQGRYFTDDTELAEVHDTLSSGSFTGYIELSENVHSGDYYVVYYGGRALFAAFVGSADRLVTGEDAFERANDEVGIYEVTPVDLAVRDVPEPPDDATGGAGGGPGVGTGTGGGAGTESGSEVGTTSQTTDSRRSVKPPASEEGETPGYLVEDAVEGVRDPDPEAARTPDERSHGSAPADVDPDGTGQDGPNASPPNEGREGADATHADGSARETDPAQPDAAGGTRAESTGEAAGSSRSDRPPRDTAEDDARFPDGTDYRTPRRGREGSGTGGADDGGVAWDDGTTVPALDPEWTAPPPVDDDDESAAGGQSTDSATSAAEAGDEAGTDIGNTPSERVAELEAEIEDLRDRVESLNEERDRLAEKRDEAASERDRLATERDELESELEALLAERETAETDLTPSEALSKTDLFVRYDAKSQTTLADAHDGDGTPETLGANLRLEIHTRFEADNATVDGEPFESFFRDTLSYRFVSWLTGEFLFEVRDTGNESALRGLYDALPEIDRVAFDGTVTSRDEEGEELSHTFDVVFRNKMGEPLIVADVDEGRDPTDGGMMAELLDRAEGVVEDGGSLAGVFAITASFFDNDVHEAVIEATKTGFLDRDSRASFVKTSRNDGYHVYLVEARGDRFHLSRPDL